MASKTVKGVKEDYGTAKKVVKSEFNKTKAKIVEMEKRAEGYIKENPKKAAAIAVGLGVAVGAAVTAYMKREK